MGFQACALLCLVGGCQPAYCQHPGIPVANGGPMMASVPLQPKLSLNSLIESNNKGTHLLPSRDGDDSQPLPAWFRVYLRKNLPGLPTSGQPQYPRQAIAFLKWLEDKQTFTSVELAKQLEAVKNSIPETGRENRQRAKYPTEWEVAVPEGTTLDAVRRYCDTRFDLLPARDLEDQSPLPVWFRVYLRQQFPGLSKSGTYQYPRTSNRILQQLLYNPDASELKQFLKRSTARSGQAGMPHKLAKRQPSRK